ncbi:interleukin-12 receptor subunit beta-2 isoform X1 [Hippoglossus hippoglossus]|uniref:interleukin-12 receptor subunit beta-2 isoform X1 n=1 Tax=Hippoglossus hippoglossus TaxID=8267 RepID=UPI00148BA63E|nr:interleukin-12 receptor subunit beta-2 isoform X1 [Hippoglossus hippoglossus]
MSQTCFVLIAAALLVVQLCMGEKSCTIWSSAGAVVQRDTSFKVYCTFNCKCRGSMYSGHPSTPQKHTELNSTTIYFKVVNITKNRTYSCQCNCSPTLDPCGLDIFTGYVPDRPKNLSCIYKVLNNKSGDVLCTWNRGRHTYLRDKTELWLRTVAGNHTSEPERHNVSSKGTGSLSVRFTVLRSVQFIYVWVQAHNELGPVVSATVDYTLTDIATPSPPVLGQPECSSRECVFTVEQPVRTQHLQIQYKAAEQTWTSYPDQSVQMSTVQAWSISSLEPYSLYHFRARSRFSTGLWSQWSTNTSSRTQEEAPAKELDVWYAESAFDLKSLRVYWKEPHISIARGKILGYRVRVYRPDSGLDLVTNFSRDARNYSVPTCANCEVTVWARNSKGLSPPATITAHHTKVSAKSSQDVQVTTGNHNVTISWREPETALLPASYVVEWHPEGQKLEELRWVRLGGSDDHAVITGIKPFECYEGAVYVFYSDSSVTRMMFSGVTTLESAPEVGPSFQETVEGQIVKVTWTELPRSKRRGCITNYTIYLENSSGHQQQYSIPASDRTYVIQPLSPSIYSLWMTASTAEGEGPVGQQMKFLIQQGTLLTNVLVFGAISLIVVIVCLCHFSAVNQKFWVFCQCLMLDVVPDPANSKWAKECTHEKGKMNLQQQRSNSSTTEEEEEPILVDIEELPRQSGDISTSTNASSQLPPQISLSLDVTPPYPATTYIKSLSQDSDSSDHTQSTTVDYISSHGLGDMEEDQEEEDQEEEEEEEMLGFFPSHHLFSGPMGFGGKLTLDAVKIDFCSDFFQDS